MLLQGFGTLLGLISLAVLGLAVFAFIDAAMRREDAYRATSKQTKPLWLIILGVTVAVNLFVPIIILQIIGLIATIVYIVDVRPAIKEITSNSGGRRPRRGSSSDGPYGPLGGGR